MLTTPAALDLICYQGATFNYTLELLIDATPVDFTTYTARMQVRATYEAEETIFNLTTGNGIILGGIAGTIDITILPLISAAQEFGTYVYDLELEDANGDVTRLIYGAFTLDPEVTR
jgi:hypothetical protein